MMVMAGAGTAGKVLTSRLLVFALGLSPLVLMAQPGNTRVVADGISEPLTAQPGDPERGRSIVGNRQLSMCLLCHTGPFPEERFQGNLAPALDGAGQRLSAAQLRLRLVDSKRINPDSFMPAYHATGGLQRVGAAWAGKPILSAQQIEDVVAYLSILRH
jgi:sulfur-oxidizing protein SoxX